MASFDEMRHRFESLHREGTVLAGGLGDLTQRATTYRHVFRESGRNHIFPLIAAHGALWARGYFRFGLRLGRVLSWQYGLTPKRRQQQLAALDNFADAFRDINRRVCVDTYANFHFTADFGEQSGAVEFVPSDLLEALNRVHAANRAGMELSDDEKRDVFTAHFLNEQQHVVGPSLDEAVTRFDWPLVREIALRPLVRFTYFPAGQRFWFGNFANREQRIEKGLGAFDVAAQVGWDRVELALHDYAVLPEAFFTRPANHFASLRQAALQASAAI